MSDISDFLGFDHPNTSEFMEPKEVAKSDKKLPPYIRGDRFSLEDWMDTKKLITFMNSMRTAPIDGIDDLIVNESYAAAVWQFRKAAIEGDLKAASAMKLWLDWAKPILGRKKLPAEIPQSPGSSAFGPRDVTADEE